MVLKSNFIHQKLLDSELSQLLCKTAKNFLLKLNPNQANILQIFAHVYSKRIDFFTNQTFSRTVPIQLHPKIFGFG
jgi:hypothetical protein